MKHTWIGDTSSASYCSACGKDYRDGPDRECLGGAPAPAMPSEGERLSADERTLTRYFEIMHAQKPPGAGVALNMEAFLVVLDEERAAARLEAVEECIRSLGRIPEKEPERYEGDNHGDTASNACDAMLFNIAATLRSLSAPPQKTQEEMT